MIQRNKSNTYACSTYRDGNGAAQHYFWLWLVVFLASCSYLKLCWLIIHGTLGNTFEEIWYDSTIPIQLQESKNIGCTMAVILSRSRCVKERWCTTSLLPCIGKATPSNCDKFDEWMLYLSITGLLFSTWTASIPHWISTVYPKKYAHGFVVLCFVVVMQSFIINLREVFIHIHQGCFAGTGAIVRLPQCQWSKPGGYGEISQCITTTKHSKAKTVCIFLGIYCISSHTKWWM